MRAHLTAGGWLLVLLLAAPISSCGSDDLTPSEARAACERDPASACCGDADCPTGYVCHFSLICAQGSDRQVTCDAPTGDRQCHVRCGATQACPGGQTCKSVTVFAASDAGDSVSFCAAP